MLSKNNYFDQQEIETTIQGLHMGSANEVQAVLHINKKTIKREKGVIIY